MAAKLVAEEGVHKGLILNLSERDEWVIGRDPESCQLLIEDPSVSRRHLLCRSTTAGILIQNLSTTNPAQINDEELDYPRLLKSGDAVRVGSELLRFYGDEVIDDSHPDISLDLSDAEALASAKPASEVIANEESPNSAPNDESHNEVADQPVNEEEAPTPIPNDELLEEGLSPEHLGDAEAPPLKEEKLAEELLPDEAQEISSPDDGELKHDSIFEDESAGTESSLAHIHFDLGETGRWLLKVISGPNTGAEFAMQSSSSYLLGTDPNFCDIVFHDTSVSRQHARLTVGEDDLLMVEDLKSRNGTLVNGEKVNAKQTLSSNTLITIGTTTFVVYDREGEMQTIISPLLPSIVKVLQKEDQATAEKTAPTDAVKPIDPPPAPPQPARSHSLGAFLLIAIITGVFILVGIGTTTLFRSAPILEKQEIDVDQVLKKALEPFPSVKYSFSKGSGRLLLVGHVLTGTDRNQLLYNLQGLSFIKNLDDSGVIIDEGVWREINQVLLKNPNWKSISIHSPEPGKFVISGYLRSRKQADQLWDYIGTNFPYPDLLEKRVVVEEDAISAANMALQNKNIKGLTIQLSEGEIVLTGVLPANKFADLEKALAEIKAIPGVRGTRSQVTEQAPEQSMINISDRYEVTGFSQRGGVNTSVIINGRIVGRGDALDGMTIVSIRPNVIFLEKDGVKYRIDYSQ